jgi:hypothetical protein
VLRYVANIPEWNGELGSELRQNTIKPSLATPALNVEPFDTHGIASLQSRLDEF